MTTRYLSKWSNDIIDEAKSKGYEVVDLEGKKATRARFIGTLKKKSAILVVLNGHGNEDVVTGHDNETILEKSDAVVEDKIIYARACRSAKKLGPELIRQGALAYLGYDEDFIFIFDQEKVFQPLDDKTAALFLEPSNYLPTAILKGHSTGEANKRSKEKFMKNIEKLLVQGPSNNDYYAIRYLLWDMNHQVCLGDASVSV